MRIMLIGSVGIVCPVGFGVVAAGAAIRAGITRFEETPWYHSGGELAVAGFAPELEAGLEDPARLMEMLELAIEDCLESSAAPLPQGMPLVLGLPESWRMNIGPEFLDAAIERAAQRFGLQLDTERSCALPRGHTAGFEALRRARGLIREDHLPACLVCAVDSFVNAKSLAWLEQHRRLKTEEHSDGVIPGEAAAAILVDERPHAVGAAVRIAGLGDGREPAGVLSKEPLRGDGLTAAATAALNEARCGFRDMAFRLADVTGEQYGFKEQALAMIRLTNQPVDEMPVWHLSDSIGDVGAAAGLCQVAVVDHAMRTGYAPGPRVICFCSGLHGERAAAVLHATGLAIGRESV